MEGVSLPSHVRQQTCLEFVNDRVLGPLDHWTARYSDLVRWSHGTGLLTAREAHTLDEEAARRPADADAVVARAERLRTALYRIFSGVAAEDQSEADTIEVLNAELARAFTALRLVATPDGFGWAWHGDEAALDRPLWGVAHAAADLLMSDKLRRVRECAAEDCQWLFIDQSRNRSRRWCDMSDCGNRAKARRHYARGKAAGQ